MISEVTMPAMGADMTEGTIVKWLKKEGDKINPGDILAEIETDKATMELESVDEGVLSKILVSEGTQSVKVNETIAVLESQNSKNEDINEIKTAPKKQNTTEKIHDKNEINQNIAKKIKEEKSTEIYRDVSSYKNLKNISVRKAINEAISEEMQLDKNVFLIGEEVGEYQGAYKVSQGLLEKFGKKRIIDTPISEEGFTGIAIGSAFNGLKPIVEYMTFNFSMQAIDQIVNTASKTYYMSGGQINVPIVFRGPNGAASQVAAQHSQDFTSWYSHCPGLKVVTPSNAYNAKGLLKSAIDDDNPVIFLENEILYGQSFEIPDSADHTVPIGNANVLRPGRDVTIATFSIMVGKALAAAETLASEGIDAEIIDLRAIRPLDEDCIIASVEKTNRLITVEEGWTMAGVGAEISSIVMQHAFDYLDAPVSRIGGSDVPLPYAANLESQALPQADDIAQAARELCS